MATFLLACQAREHASCSCCHDFRAAPVCCGNLHIQHTATFSEVSSDSLYLTDDTNVAIFPNAEGSFSSLDLTLRAHYEVHGDPIEMPQNTPSTSPFASIPVQRHFSFTRPASSGSVLTTTPRASRSWTRAINIAEVQDGKPVPKSVVVVRFTEAEASVTGIVQKLQADLRAAESPVLLDSNWNEIMDSEGTRGSQYWRQTSRKINAMLISHFSRLQHRRKRMREEDSGLQDILEKIEEVLEASQGLESVAVRLWELTTLATRDRNQVNMHQASQLTFTCLVCRDIISEPMLSECCRSIIGCRACIEEWALTSNQCLKCRSEFSVLNIIRVAGLSTVLDVVKELA
ncbi:uncharacterized protein LOC120480077 [Pimephales promelas]|uniref:uncharacterized protein LOC120480077 n=1 Tax=Pimephales promelas TaxID=90988 RepID=UPI001955D9D1|nr:uncharacterized protein LOC120480077 [Pimephales promelas]